MIFSFIDIIIYIWFPLLAVFIFLLASGKWGLVKFIVALILWAVIFAAIFIGNNLFVDWNNGKDVKKSLKMMFSSTKFAHGLFAGGILLIVIAMFLLILSIGVGQYLWIPGLIGFIIGVVMIITGFKIGL